MTINTIATSIATIRRGNHYDSRIGDHSYTLWTDGDDYEIRLSDGRVFGFQTRSYEHTSVSQLDVPVEFIGETRELTWEKLNTAVKTALFSVLFPEGTEEERNQFVLGEDEGAEKNRINAWSEAHLVHTRAVTLRLREELGEFKSVRFIKSYSRWAGTGYRNYVYVIDEKWQVTVVGNCYSGEEFYDSYQVEDYTKIVASQKAYGRRVARLAKIAGVPWHIAVFAGNIADDGEAIEVLKVVKAAKGTADENLQWELSCGIGRRCAAIGALLGEAWQKPPCSGQRQTTTLANYLLGSEE